MMTSDPLRVRLAALIKHWRFLVQIVRDCIERYEYPETWEGLATAELAVPEGEADAVDILRAIVYASDQCQGHRGCAHSMEPWQRARRLISAVDGEPTQEKPDAS